MRSPLKILGGSYSLAPDQQSAILYTEKSLEVRINSIRRRDDQE